jgi:hypothetical protein
MAEVPGDNDNDDEVDDEWRGHPLREFLRLKLVDGSIPIRGKEMGTAAVWNKYCDDHPRLFEGMKCNKLFAQRLGSLRRLTKKDRLRADADQEAFDIHRANFPYRQWNDSGDLMWHGHEAEELLKLDMHLYLHYGWTPMEIYYKRPAYQEFSLKRFRGHIHQNIDTAKYIHTLEVRDEEKKEKKRLEREKKKEAAAMRAVKKAEKAAKKAAEAAEAAKKAAEAAKTAEAPKKATKMAEVPGDNDNDDEVDDEWRSHPLREFLRLKLVDGSIPIRGKEMGTAAVWNKYCDDHPRLFEGMKCNKLFAQRLGSLRRLTKKDRLRADPEAAEAAKTAEAPKKATKKKAPKKAPKKAT